MTLETVSEEVAMENDVSLGVIELPGFTRICSIEKLIATANPGDLFVWYDTLYIGRPCVVRYYIIFRVSKNKVVMFDECGELKNWATCIRFLSDTDTFWLASNE